MEKPNEAMFYKWMTEHETYSASLGVLGQIGH